MKFSRTRWFSIHAVILALILSASSVHGYITGPDPSYTKAPGEVNCTFCHTPGGGLSGSVTISGNPANYTAGATYALTVSVSGGAARNGFQLTALLSTGARAGNLANTTANTQLKTNAVSGNSRQYIEHTLAGSDFSSWTFNWTAPNPAAGAVSFYASGLRSNKDTDTTLDNVYNRTNTSAAPVPPANDNFANSDLLTGNVAHRTNSTLNATKESGEPNHAGNAGGASVWYRWVAPSNGIAIFDTKGSSFDTLLGVYTGAVVSVLTTIASDDDSGGSNASLLSFVAVSNTTYRIAVDGYLSASGTHTLNLSLEQPPRLSIARTTTNTFLISWPISPPGFALESATPLSPPASWATVTNLVITVGNTNMITHGNLGTNRFFRLKRP